MASSGVNVKMGVSGIAQFKQNMNQAKQAVKTLDAQIALSEKQFKATGDAESFMTEKSELLKAKLEQQKNVIAQAENALKAMADKGVDRSSKAYQDMYRQMLQAQGGLLDIQMEMQGVEQASDGAADAVSDMTDDLNSINSQVSFKTVTEGLSGITGKLEAAAKKAIQLGKELVNATLGAGSWADELVTTAAMYREIDPSITPEKLQRMRKTAQLIDTDVDAIISSKQKLATAMGKKDIDDIFAEFGIQNTRYGEFENLDDMFWAVGEAVMKLDNETERAQLGKKLFGNWTELAPLFRTGREEYERTMEAQSVVTQENIDKLTAMDDSYQNLKNEIETLSETFFATLAPSITTVTDSLSNLIGKFNEYLQTDEGKEKMQAIGDNIEKLFSSLTNFDPDQAIETIGRVMDGINNAFDWISKNWETISMGLKAIGAGWAAIKVATIGLNIGSLVAGFKGLPFFGGGNGGGGGAPTVASTPKGTTAGGGKTIIPTVASNVLNKAAGETLSVVSASGLLLPVVGDRFLNETNAGRAVRDSQGIDAVIEGARQDVTAAADEFVKNLHSFNDDWERLVNTVWNETFGVEGDGGSHGFDAGPAVEENKKATERLDASTDRMEETTSDLVKSTNYQTKSANDLSRVVGDLNGLPDDVKDAIISGMNGVTFELDGEVITAVVNKRMGEDIDSERR